MRGLWLENQELSYRTDLPLPTVGAGEALIKLILAGVCSTDLEMVRGYYPFTGIPGHEFVGEVVAAPGNESWIGQRVVGEISITCGVCEACAGGRKSHCENRRTLGLTDYDGTFAEYLKLPVSNLHRVPGKLRDEQAVFTELLAAALQVQTQVQVKPTDRVVVVGAGRLGLLIAQCLRLTGCDLSVVVRHDAPKKLLEAWGIRAVFAEELAPRRADIVVEVTGSPQGFERSHGLVRPAGTLVMKSTFAGDVTLNLSGLVVDEIRLVGSRCGPFTGALRLLEEGLVDVDALISGRFAMRDGLAAFEQAGQPGALKVLIES